MRTLRDALPPSPAVCFVAVAAPFGLAFALLTPPMQFPDEGNHFKRAYQISEGVLLGRRWVNEAGRQEAGGEIPLAVLRASRATRGIAMHPERKTSPARMIEQLRVPFAPHPRVPANFWNTSRFSPAPYLPQALAMAMARPFQPPTLVFMYLGRLASLLFGLAAIFLALRWIPVGAWALFVIATLPISLCMLASTGADGVTIACAFLLAALVLRLAYTEVELTLGRLVGIAVLSAAVGVSKQVYLLLPLLFLLIPASRSPAPRLHRRRLAVVLAATLIPWALWSALATRVMVPPRPMPWVDPWVQLEFVLGDPLGYAALFVDWLVRQFPTTFVHSLHSLGWLDVALSPVLPWLAAGALVIALCLDRNDAVRIRLWHRALAAALLFTSFVLVVTSGYLYWTYPRAPWIGGFQGRYVLPLAPLLVVIASNPRPRFAAGTRLRPLLVLLPLASAAALLSAIFSSLDRYYGLGG